MSSISSQVVATLQNCSNSSSFGPKVAQSSTVIPEDDLSHVLKTLCRPHSSEKVVISSQNSSLDKNFQSKSIRKVSVDSLGSLTSIPDSEVMGGMGVPHTRGIHLPCHTVLPGQRYPMMVLKRR